MASTFLPMSSVAAYKLSSSASVSSFPFAAGLRRSNGVVLARVCSARVSAMAKEWHFNKDDTSTSAAAAVATATAPGRNLYLNPRLQQKQQQVSVGRGDEVKRIIDILLRTKKRNPILVGESEPEAAIKDKED